MQTSVKVCTICKELKDRGEFHLRKKGKPYLQSWCKACKSKVNSTYDEKAARKNLLKRRGLSNEEYSDLLIKQNSACAICKSSFGHQTKSGKKANLAIDHDHSTGLVRGLLCNKCNRALGYFQDDVEIIQRAIYYLLNFERKT